MKSINDKVAITVYRGQGLLNAEFDMLATKECGLLSFNCFLSTSSDQQIALIFAESAKQDPEITGVLFEIKLYPSIWSSSAFAVLDENTGYFTNNEQEILFTMHTMFRIDKIKNIEHRLWKIELTLTEENDPQLKILTDYMRNESTGFDGWHRLMHLMTKLAKYDQVEKIVGNLQDSISGDSWLDAANTAAMDSIVKCKKGDYINALSLAYKSLTICQKYAPKEDISVGQAYSTVGLNYKAMGDYAAALYYYTKSLSLLEACQKSHKKSLAAVYNNIGVVQDLMRNHSTAILYYQKVLEIGKLHLPQNHPDLAGTYANIGIAYQSMAEYASANMFLEKSKEILQKVVPHDHPSLLNIHKMLSENITRLKTAELCLGSNEKHFK
jgi:tetratricopeptide (TPR) repeat protein